LNKNQTNQCFVKFYKDLSYLFRLVTAGNEDCSINIELLHIAFRRNVQLIAMCFDADSLFSMLLTNTIKK